MGYFSKQWKGARKGEAESYCNSFKTLYHILLQKGVICADEATINI